MVEADNIIHLRSEPCENCDGKRELIYKNGFRTKCRACGGTGLESERRKRSLGEPHLEGKADG